MPGRKLLIEFWGVRGSIPTPGPGTQKYGGNTACIEIIYGNDKLIFDAGTGIRVLGKALLNDNLPHDIHLFISHTHWDHIIGFPFFAPAFVKGVNLHIYGPYRHIEKFEEIFSWQMNSSYFPVAKSNLDANICFYTACDIVYNIGPFNITSHKTNHPVYSLAFKIRTEDETIVYTGDHEPYFVPRYGQISTQELDYRLDLAEKYNRKFSKFIYGADTLICDSSYFDEEYPTHMGWGHCSIGLAIDIAREAMVKRLILFHHEPNHTDVMFDRMTAYLANKIGSGQYPKEIIFAKEGAIL